ncbi:MAG: hypothetical protein RLZZ444_4045 [Pseudomonadota bacterium]|jgi:hypothetical protein
MRYDRVAESAPSTGNGGFDLNQNNRCQSVSSCHGLSTFEQGAVSPVLMVENLFKLGLDLLHELLNVFNYVFLEKTNLVT